MTKPVFFGRVVCPRCSISEWRLVAGGIMCRSCGGGLELTLVSDERPNRAVELLKDEALSILHPAYTANVLLGLWERITGRSRAELKPAPIQSAGSSSGSGE